MTNKHRGSNVMDLIAEIEKSRPAAAEAMHVEFDRLELARRIRSARETLGVSQADLADRIGSSQPAIARAEKGTFAPRLDVLARIAAALGARLDVRFLFSRPVEHQPRRAPVERTRIDVLKIAPRAEPRPRHGGAGAEVALPDDDLLSVSEGPHRVAAKKVAERTGKKAGTHRRGRLNVSK